MSKALSAREVISILMNRFGNEWKIFIPTIRTEMFLLAVSTTMYLLNNDGMDQLPYLQEQNTGTKSALILMLKNFRYFAQSVNRRR